MPTGLMIVAGLSCVFVPIVLMIPLYLVLDVRTQSLPLLAEVFVFFGWLPGLVALPFALALAHWANRNGLNGWLLPLIAGALLGGIGALAIDGDFHLSFLAASMTLGVLHGACFWTMAHGLSVLAVWKQQR
ncbi:hypothetical protein [Gymnodinialimonas sp.]